MVSLSNLDFLLILLYFGILLAIGYFTSRKQKAEDYLIAKRELSSWSTMATINASKTGSILMIFVALTYLWGFAALWYFIGMILGVLIFLPFALKLKEKSVEHRYYTLADYFKHNYGRKIATFVSLITIFLMFGYLVLNLMAGSKIFVFFTGWPFWLCAVIMMLVVLTYILMGGFKAVVRTDVVQYFAMIILLALLALALFKGALIPVGEWNILRADIGTIIGFFIVGILFPFAMPDMWQRVYAAKDKKELKKGMLISVGFYALFAFLLGLLALTIKVQFPGIDPDLALIHGFGNLLPSGLLGLATILLFAAIMSSADTYIFTGASAVIQDFFDWDRKKTVKYIRRVVFVLAVLATLISIWIQDLVLSAYIFVSFILALAIIVFATWFRRKIKQATLMVGLSIGVISIIALLIYFILFAGGVRPVIAVIALATTIIGLLIGGIVSYFRKK
jgi:SSS family solute:Na+ symporter